MNTNKILFSTQAIGYDQDQVDSYIQKLTDEYDSLQRNFTELYDRYDRLVKKSGVGMASVSQTMADAEVKAEQLITEANNEAARIIRNAHIELGQIQHTKDRLITEISDILNGLRGIVPSGS